MHSGVLVDARPLYKVLSLGHVWLFLLVCACWGNTEFVGEVGFVGQLASDPLPGRDAPSLFLGPLRVPGWARGALARYGRRGCPPHL